jgi:integrase/recombinase XerD
MEQIIERFENYLGDTQLAKRTRENYSIYARSFLKHAAKPLNEITITDIERILSTEKRKAYISPFLNWLKQEGEINLDRFQNDNDKAIQELGNNYYRHLELQDQRAATIEATKSNLKIFFSFLADRGIVSLQRISREVISEFIKHLHEKRYSVTYRYLVVLKLKDFFGYLRRSGEVLVDPTVNVGLPKLPKRFCHNTVSVRELDELITAIDTDTPLGFRDLCMIEMLYGTGMRVGEIVNLKRSDIAVRDRTILIREGKGRKDRIVPLNRYAMKLVSRYINETRKTILGERTSPFLFAAERSERLNKLMVSRFIKRYAKRAGLTRTVTAHTLRHSCATHLLENGADIRYIQALLGHANLSATQIYTKVVIKDLKQTVERCHPLEQSIG